MNGPCGDEAETRIFELHSSFPSDYRGFRISQRFLEAAHAPSAILTPETVGVIGKNVANDAARDSRHGRNETSLTNSETRRGVSETRYTFRETRHDFTVNSHGKSVAIHTFTVAHDISSVSRHA